MSASEMNIAVLRGFTDTLAAALYQDILQLEAMVHHLHAIRVAHEKQNVRLALRSLADRIITTLNQDAALDGSAPIPPKPQH